MRFFSVREKNWPMFAFRASRMEKQEDGQRMRILGIDPGLRTLGWGVIDSDGARLSHVANGLCPSEGDELADRLKSIYDQLSGNSTFVRFCPSSCIVWSERLKPQK